MQIQRSEYLMKTRPVFQISKGTTYVSNTKNEDYKLPNYQQSYISFTANRSKEVYSIDKLTTKILELRNASSPLASKYREYDGDIVQFIKHEKPKAKEAIKFLYSVSMDPKLSTRMITELTQEPQNTRNKYTKLKKAVCDDKKSNQLFLAWLNDEEAGYKFAYSQYYESLWQKASSLEEIIRFSPNIAPWALENKANILNRDFSFGELPSEFGSVEDFKKLISSIKSSAFYKAYVLAKDGSNDIKVRERLAKEYNTSADSFMIDSILNEKLAKEAKVSIKTENGCTLQPIVQSFSAKLIFKVDTPNGNTFFLKIDPYRPDPEDKSDMAKKLRENQDLRPDMPYLNAMVDFYLKLNNCRYASDVQYYNHDYGAIIYKASKGKEPTNAIDQRILKNLYLLRGNKIIQEIQQYGIQLNDVHNGNFMQDEFGNISLIDSGHIYYEDPLKPVQIGKHISLGNLCGRECKQEFMD